MGSKLAHFLSCQLALCGRASPRRETACQHVLGETTNDGWIHFWHHTNTKVASRVESSRVWIGRRSEMWLASGVVKCREGSYFREAPHATIAQPPRPLVHIHTSIGVQGATLTAGRRTLSEREYKTTILRWSQDLVSVGVGDRGP